jgi:hypothetical protein
MGVDIDKARRENPSASLDHLLGGVLGKLPDGAYETGIDGNVRCLRFGAAPVEHTHIPDQSLTTGHRAW